ncbi:multicopper oxidase family protein [Oceanobacter mangrovi]|uniref:multicopper oxidase family protein n=1 Tax=Oceanobacter mangrovi TaxID=2862510 RepID=UPI001C8E7A68|nr:multicopper oxidase family protein [Oceanobacter mangrovi]
MLFTKAINTAALSLVIISTSSCASTTDKHTSHGVKFAADECISRQQTSPGHSSLAEPLKLKRDTSVAGEVRFDMTIDEVTNQLFNPTTGDCDTVELRAYMSAETDPKAPYVAPTIEMKPGETARVTLRNHLDPDASCEGHPEDPNTPHCFNGTNLHTHGLWISPSGNSDNVLIKINPGVDFQYEYNVPVDHPAGTFWYHPHLHGSTALQVSSGMVGALIIKGERQPQVKAGKLVKTGDLDVLLTGFKDRTLVMQQIAYACFDSDGNIIKNSAGQWVCSAGQTGEIRNYEDQFGPGSWPASGRYTSINGVVLPTIQDVPVGAVERWRMIHAGVRDTIDLVFCKAEAVENERLFMAKTNPEALLQANCFDARDKLNFQVVAADGLTMEQAQATGELTFQPGYRWDLLVQFPEMGDWYMIDRAATAQGNINADQPTPRFLGLVKVINNTQAPTSLTDQLIASARLYIDPAAQPKVINDLENGLKLSSFVPHRSLLNDPQQEFGRQELGFNIDTTTTTTPLFMVANQLPENPDFDPQPYSPDRIDRDLILGAKDEWYLGSAFVGHPYHIHVNPFQIVKILNPAGVDVTAEGVDDVSFEYYADSSSLPDWYATLEDCKARVTENGGSCQLALDSEYRGLKGIWKDTIFVKQGYTIIARTEYRRYIGEFVLHCHILDHEDQGMMQNVRISVGDGKGAPAMAHGKH